MIPFNNQGEASNTFWYDKSWRFMVLLLAVAMTTLMVLAAKGKQVTLVVDGERHELYTYQGTVGDLLAGQNIALKPDDLVQPDRKQVTKNRQEITITRVAKKEIIVEEQLPFETVKELNDQLLRGQERVIHPGEHGLKQQIYQRVLHDGQAVSQRLVKTVTVSEPQPKVIAVGNKEPVLVASRAGSRASYAGGKAVGTISMTATAYTYTGNNTASGVPPRYGGVAVDPRVIPLGTKLYVEGYGEAVALDRGGAIQGARIDLFFPTQAECTSWGRRTVQVHIVE